MGSKDNDIKRNGSGYFDPTAYAAIKSLDEKYPDPDDARFHKLLDAIFAICELSDFISKGELLLRIRRPGKFGGNDMATIHLEERESGNPLEVANAIIKAFVGGTFDRVDEDYLRLRQGELAQVVEHIQTYLTYNCPGYLRRF